MTTRFWLPFVALLLAACGAPEDRAPSEADLAASAQQAVAALPQARRHAAPARLEWRDPSEPRTFPANLQRAREAVEAAACMESCGGAPWCAALCEIDAFSPVADDPAAGHQEQECPECGRETGFLPSPPTVEAYREGSGVLVTWSEVLGADAYEVAVLRRKDARDAYVPWADYTVEATELRLSSLPTGYLYIFAVAPDIDGEVNGGLTGISSPLSL